MIGNPAIAGAKDAWDAGEFRCGIERPAPPDLPGEKDDRFGAAVDLAVCHGDAHFPEQILGRQGKKGLHPWVLQSGKPEAALLEWAAEAASERGADAAVAIEEDPAAGRMFSFRISHF